MIEFMDTYMLELSGLVLVAVTVALFAWTRSLPARCRRFGYAIVLAPGAMAIAYLLMTPVETQFGVETDFLRFIGYTVMWVPIVYVLAAVAGVGRTLFLTLLGIVLGRVWITLIAWFLDGILGLLATLVPFALLAAGIYLLFGPYTESATATTDARALLFDKLKYLVVLAWIGLVVNGLVAADGLGLIATDFVGQVAVVYVEILLVTAFGVLTLTNADALEDLADAGWTTDTVGSLERVDGAEPDAAG
ncbi:bacteriorhodopsin [Natrarchaeobaculum aegyptiacum]|uniref:Rhodopsin n=1 Tax=Natrarchaeobaculum aegyptiacum TaxID=745377 RepID=A0A2Z2HQI3_9EURY|nr:bacteriorhodopsin [Natrarchaeobaculum aegyptiacum]ARS89410.1 rhodopsin [Natrarchaeobaculum aegyptiacum]